MTISKTAGKTAKALATGFAKFINAQALGDAIMTVYSTAYDTAQRVRATLGIAHDGPIPMWGALSDYLAAKPVKGFGFDEVRMVLIRAWDAKYVTGTIQPRDARKSKEAKAMLKRLGVKTAEGYFRLDSASRGRLVEGNDLKAKVAKELRQSIIPGWCSDKWNGVARIGMVFDRNAIVPKSIVDRLRATKVELLPRAYAKALEDGHGETIPAEIADVVMAIRKVGWAAKVKK
jgi:hypothetical protein